MGAAQTLQTSSKKPAMVPQGIGKDWKGMKYEPSNVVCILQCKSGSKWMLTWSAMLIFENLCTVRSIYRLHGALGQETVENSLAIQLTDAFYKHIWISTNEKIWNQCGRGCQPVQYSSVNKRQHHPYLVASRLGSSCHLLWKAGKAHTQTYVHIQSYTYIIMWYHIFSIIQLYWN